MKPDVEASTETGSDDKDSATEKEDCGRGGRSLCVTTLNFDLTYRVAKRPWRMALIGKKQEASRD